MTFKIRKIAKPFKEGFALAREKEWKYAQLQTRLKYRTEKGVKAQEFKTTEEADKFKRQLIKRGYKKNNIFIENEPIAFEGAVCNSIQPLTIVYYSRKKVWLTPEDHSLSNKAKALKYLVVPHLKKPNKEEVEKFKENFQTRAYYYSKKPVCNI